MSLRFGRHALPRLVGSLRGKSEKASEDLEALENIEREIERLRKRLNEARESASNLYIYGVDQDATEIELDELRSQVEDLVDTAKKFSGNIKARYQASQQLVPSDITQHLTALELCAEATAQTMEEKQREQKRARTVRSDYLVDVDEVQTWIRQAELKVQDRSVEPAILREHLRQIQNELGTISDKLERLTRNGQTIIKNTRDDAEKELINSTIGNLTEQLAQVRSWLEEKKQIVGDTLDAWQRFLTLYEAVKAWTEEKRQFLVEPLKLSTLVQARQRLHEYSTAVKSCKQVNKNLSDMGRELENIAQVTSVGDLPEKLAEAEEGKVQVEGQLLERNALLQEASEEWEQCEKKMKDVRSWMEKARQTLESPQNKKKPLRDQHAIREKMLSDIAIQKTKITISVEKLEVHFRSGIVGDNRVKDTADDLIAELNSLHSTVKEQTTSLEACLAQIDQYQQEIQQLRQHIVQVEQQLRTVLSPTYMPNDREKALQEQQDVEEGLASLKANLSNLEGTIGYLPRDSVESMLSSLMAVLTELRAYNEEATQLQKQLDEIPADIECQRFSIALTGIRTRITSLLDQAEQGRVALEQARAHREKRGQEIHTYKLFLEETDAWLKNIVSKLHEQYSINTNKALQEELMSRVHQVSELESLPEVSVLAIALKEALLDVINRLQRKQQVSNAFQNAGAFANITILHGASIA